MKRTVVKVTASTCSDGKVGIIKTSRSNGKSTKTKTRKVRLR